VEFKTVHGNNLSLKFKQSTKKEVMPAFYIYALLCDKTDDIVYVGQTQCPHHRLQAHRYSIKKGSKSVYVHFRNNNSVPEMVIIERLYAPFTNEPNVMNAELYWIEVLKKCGFNILNSR
jgi:predicted GIY-YIG superfamily endonuclease